MIENYFDIFNEEEFDIRSFVRKFELILSSNQCDHPNVKSLTLFLSNLDLDRFDHYMETYIISTHDTPEDISEKLYNSKDYWWIALLINKMSYFDFPLNAMELHSTAVKLYQEEHLYSLNGYKKILTRENDISRSIKVPQYDKLFDFLKELHQEVKSNA